MIPSYSIGVWAPILTAAVVKISLGLYGGRQVYRIASIFVTAEYSDRKRGFMTAWLDFGSIAGFVTGAGVVVLISSVVGEGLCSSWDGVCRSTALPLLGLIGLYLYVAAGRDSGVPTARSVPAGQTSRRAARRAEVSFRDCDQTGAACLSYIWSGDFYLPAEAYYACFHPPCRLPPVAPPALLGDLRGADCAIMVGYAVRQLIISMLSDTEAVVVILIGSGDGAVCPVDSTFIAD